jgi:hypothetical protein
MTGTKEDYKVKWLPFFKELQVSEWRRKNFKEIWNELQVNQQIDKHSANGYNL